MGEYNEAYVAFDTSKTKHAVAIAEIGRRGEVRFLGEVASSPGRVEHLVGKLAERYSNGTGGRNVQPPAGQRQRPVPVPVPSHRRAHRRHYVLRASVWMPS